ncbi:MAG: metallopeptidase TldD-related protein [Anaerolineales bacterium]
MKEKIIEILGELRQYALDKGYQIALAYHEEDSYLMRFANSAISLNTNEHLIRLTITAYEGKQRASYQLITNLDQIDEIKQAIDQVAEMVQHSQPLNYQPTIPIFSETFIDESGYDPALATISNADRLDFVNQVVEGLETEDLKLSGIFANGMTIRAFTNTLSEHVLFFKTSDAQVEIVMAHAKEKWEAITAQSAQQKRDLDPSQMREELLFLLERYQKGDGTKLELGRYNIVFGPAAIADLLSIMRYIGFNGGTMKRGYSFLKEEQVGQKVFSDKFTLVDDPDTRETFPFKHDFTGIAREKRPLIENGVFTGYIWTQDDADEFGTEATGHTVSHLSLALEPGTKDVGTLEELSKMPREKDVLYIPFLHYMNIVNPSQGVVTATSRFGTMLLKADGTTQMLYNVRLTQSLLEIFGDKLTWLSNQTHPHNISMSYGPRNPTAIVLPRFMQVEDLEISHANSSY